MDCQNLASIVRGDGVKLATYLTGDYASSQMFSLAVEIDIPWKSEQKAEYGDSFAAWTELEFMATLTALTTTLPFVKYALVV